MRRRCKGGVAVDPNYADVELRMTMDEWLTWCLPRYRRLLRRFPHESPAAARIGDAGHYEIGNIKIILQIANRREQRTRLLLRPDGMKLCQRCETVKPKAAFAKNRSRPDGLQHECRPCRTVRHRAWRLKKKGA